MNANVQLQTVFHLTGRSPAAPLKAIDKLGLRPAMLARYRDLSRLRYDFPLVLVNPAAGKPLARSLTDVVNELARKTAAAGPVGEALRRQLLHVEHEIRSAVAAGARGRLSELWKVAAERVTKGADAKVAESLRGAGKVLPADGEVIDCDEAMAEKLLAHAFRVTQGERLAKARKDIEDLVTKLQDILRADFVRSEAGQTAEALRVSVGTKQQGLFDFKMMARMLALGSQASRLSSARRKRIESTLKALCAQRFFPTAKCGETEPYEFAFDSCRAVQQAFRERLAPMAELVKAMSIAELESDGRYDESRHDAFFDSFDATSLSPQDMEIFPAYFVCLRGRSTGAATDANLMELLSSGIPVKVLVETDDLLEEASLGQGHFAFGVRSVQLASLATGLTDTFVLQSVASNLLQLHDRLRRGLAAAGPALFSVFTPSAAQAGRLPRYLVGAAAMQSRAFPAFSYDPSAGTDMASRFSLEDNPQPDRDWPVSQFDYADASLQRVTEELAFTLADFVAADPRHARHFACVPHADWSEHMVPIGDWLSESAGPKGNRVPYVLAVDAQDNLQRLIVDEKLVQAARRCLNDWHRLQELGGVHNSHAERMVARVRAIWEEQKRQEIEALTAAGAATAAAEPAPAEATAPAAAATPEVVEAEPERSPDEPYIETIRCSTCNECTQINDKMFAYNDNKQAYIKDRKAGTYRQMVEAAESCQLGIIHPGKPLDPKEPGLEELLERAKPFL
jgi:cytochrome c5